MKLYRLIPLLLLSQLTFSQSIQSYLLNIDKYKKDADIAEIIETTSFYYPNGVTKDVEYKSFDSAMNLTSLKRFDDENKLVWAKTYKYDNRGRKVRVDNKKWINVIGYQFGYSIYTYDTNNNFVQYDYNSQGGSLYISKYYFDKNMNLIRLENIGAYNQLIGYETAAYDFDHYRVTISQFNDKDKLIGKNYWPFEPGDHFDENPANKHNEHGDPVYWERKLYKKDNVCYTVDYVYDDRGNWTSGKRYSYKKTRKGELKKKKLVMMQTREITYNE